MNLPRNRRLVLCLLQASLICSLATIGPHPSAYADTIYSYTGATMSLPHFAGFNSACASPPYCAVNGSVTLSDSLPANFASSSSFSFTTPIQGITLKSFDFQVDLVGVGTTVYDFSTSTAYTTPGFYEFHFATDNSAMINQWGISLTLIFNGLGLSSVNSVGGGSDELTGAPNSLFLEGSNLPGSWSSAPATVPEPSSLLMLGTGLLGVVGAARRKWLSNPAS